MTLKFKQKQKMATQGKTSEGQASPISVQSQWGITNLGRVPQSETPRTPCTPSVRRSHTANFQSMAGHGQSEKAFLQNLQTEHTHPEAGTGPPGSSELEETLDTRAMAQGGM